MEETDQDGGDPDVVQLKSDCSLKQYKLNQQKNNHMPVLDILTLYSTKVNTMKYFAKFWSMWFYW